MLYVAYSTRLSTAAVSWVVGERLAQGLSWLVAVGRGHGAKGQITIEACSTVHVTTHTSPHLHPGTSSAAALHVVWDVHQLAAPPPSAPPTCCTRSCTPLSVCTYCGHNVRYTRTAHCGVIRTHRTPEA